MVVATTGSVNRFTRSPRRYLISVGQRSISAGEQVRLTWIDDNGKNCCSAFCVWRAARMATRNIGILIDGATGRLGSTQHLRSLMAIRFAGTELIAPANWRSPTQIFGFSPSRARGRCRSERHAMCLEPRGVVLCSCL